jgi:hypothetical protein
VSVVLGISVDCANPALVARPHVIAPPGTEPAKTVQFAVLGYATASMETETHRPFRLILLDEEADPELRTYRLALPLPPNRFSTSCTSSPNGPHGLAHGAGAWIHEQEVARV